MTRYVHMILLSRSIILQNNYKPSHYTHNNLTKQCLRNHVTQITKQNPLTKSTAPIAIEQIILSLLVSKNNEMMKINAIPMQDQNPLKNLLYNISAPPPTIEHKDMIQDQLNTPLDIVVEVHPVTTTKNIIDNDLLQELAIITTEIQRDSRSYRSPYRSSYRSHHRRDSRPRYKSRSYSRDNNFQDTPPLIDHRLDLEILDILDPVHIPRHKTKSIIFNHKLLLIQSTLKYTCITQQK